MKKIVFCFIVLLTSCNTTQNQQMKISNYQKKMKDFKIEIQEINPAVFVKYKDDKELINETKKILQNLVNISNKIEYQNSAINECFIKE
jgi:peptidoglycan hydrolase CwlO-like protein